MSFYTIGRKDDKRSSLMQINKELLEEDHFKDVTMVSDDLHVVKAHKALLSKSSDVFRQILMLQDDKNPIIFIRGSSQKQLKSILNFIYLGETEVTEEDINVFLQLAKDFKLKEFADTKTKNVVSGTMKNQNIDIITQKMENESEKDFEYIDNESNKTEISMAEEAAEDDNDIQQTSDLYDPDDYHDNSSSLLLAEGDIKDEHFENGKEMHEQNEMNTSKSMDKEPNKQELTSNGRIKCTYTGCNKEFTSYGNMRVHYKVSHEGFAIKCGLCVYKTTRTNLLRKHKQKNHKIFTK